jgi:hypothetical protein
MSMDDHHDFFGCIVNYHLSRKLAHRQHKKIKQIQQEHNKLVSDPDNLKSLDDLSIYSPIVRDVSCILMTIECVNICSSIEKLDLERETLRVLRRTERKATRKIKQSRKKRLLDMGLL